MIEIRYVVTLYPASTYELSMPAEALGAVLSEQPGDPGLALSVVGDWSVTRSWELAVVVPFGNRAYGDGWRCLAVATRDGTPFAVLGRVLG